MSYKDTVFLPQTSFSMKAQLPEREPGFLKMWQQEKIYEKIQEKNKDGEIFFLHDGPPYANGHLHVGHALNRILKDTLLKYKNLLGFKAPFVPGWDCHGLPIEWMVEGLYREQGQDKALVSPLEFRQSCRDFAQKWVNIQSQEAQRLGVLGDWSNPYLTMQFQNEALISEELLGFLMRDSLYKGVKPVFWSVVEKTALAEAEVEYKDKVSSSLYVLFPMAPDVAPALKGAYALIWTTTPWSLPGNRAIAYQPDATYVVAEIQSAASPHLIGKKIVVAESRLSQILAEVQGTAQVVSTLAGEALCGAHSHHPWRASGYDFPVPFLPGDHVTLDQGTGLVHTAPGHGVDDFKLGLAHGLEIAQPLDDSGIYHDHVPLWRGKHVYKVNGEIIQSLQDLGLLFSEKSITHSYPHSWRSKAPLIFRTTPQWFISMETNDLREKALAAIDGVTWVPSQGRNRIHAMVKSRPDWCLSRQRSWGVPLPIFVSKKTGEPLKDAAVNARILALIQQEGSDAWFKDETPAKVLAPHYDPKDFEKCQDVVDVWFESGCTYLFVSQERNLPLPADLYLEGSDQHRGWFQSSLLESVGSRGVAPYKAVFTHGFVVDQEGYKMSKSAGNSVALEQIIQDYGADILRLWVLGSDYAEDLKIGKDILKHQEDIYRRLRNTLRYLLGNLRDQPYKGPRPPHLPLLEQWVLHRLKTLGHKIQEHLKVYDLHSLFKDLYQFCTTDLSAFYFDIRKDALYCESRDSETYQAIAFTLQTLFDTLTVWLSPILSFTAEEAWQTLYPGKSVHLENWPTLPADFENLGLEQRMLRLRDIRKVATGALEQARTQRQIGSSLEASVTLYVGASEKDLFQDLPLPDFLITSDADVRFQEAPADAYTLPDFPGVGTVVELAPGLKCERCWRVLEEVEVLCHRCLEAIP